MRIPIRARRSAALVAVVLVGALLVGCADEGEQRSSSTTLGVDEVVPPEVGSFEADWPLPGRDYANSRAVPDSAITTGSVGRLTEVWRAEIPGQGAIGNASTTPLVLGDRVLVQDLDSNVRAFDRAGGELLWETEVEGGLTIGPNGVAVGWGHVYAAKGSKEIFALDLETGEELWSTELVSTETGGIDIQPQVVAGLVLVSTVPVNAGQQYVGGDRGVLHALDAATGEVVWRFDTIADEDLWGNPEVNSGGGAWFPPAVDTEAGVVYWGIANPAPFPGTAEFPNASSRPGENLYTDSVVALDVETGELIWCSQVIPHDLFDRDHIHVMLAETGSGRIVVSTGKGGIVVGHDPETGEILWRSEVGVHRNDDLTELEGPTEVWPGTFGGVITPPATADGVVYVATLNAPTELSPDEPAYIGSQLGRAPGEVAAVDAVDGELLWSTEVDGDPLGGATVVGDLVFTGTFQGRIYALDRDTGEIVWEHEAPGGLNAWPAVAGDLIVWPIGMAEPPVLLALGLGE